jgi:hypothetical protein
MDLEGSVHAVSVQHGGIAHHASFFVEDGTIHATVDGRTVLLPLGHLSAADSVRALLLARLHKYHRHRIADWFNASTTGEHG